MKLFEVGKEYKLNGGGKIRITRRSNWYVTYEGAWERWTGKEFISVPVSGRKMVSKGTIFTEGELIVVPVFRHMQVFCYADRD